MLFLLLIIIIISIVMRSSSAASSAWNHHHGILNLNLQEIFVIPCLIQFGPPFSPPTPPRNVITPISKRMRSRKSRFDGIIPYLTAHERKGFENG